VRGGGYPPLPSHFVEAHQPARTDASGNEYGRQQGCRVAEERQTPEGVLERAHVLDFRLRLIYAAWAVLSALGALVFRAYQSFGIGNTALLAVGVTLLGIWGLPRIFELVHNRHGGGITFSKVVASLLAGALVIFVWTADKLPSWLDNTPTQKPLMVVPLAAETVPSSPKKFYSQRDKDKLADALTDLSDLLNKNADPMVASMKQFLDEWKTQTGYKPTDYRPDVEQLQPILTNLQQSNSIISTSLYNNPGLLSQYQVFAEELSNILKPPDEHAESDPLTQINTVLGYLQNGLALIEQTEKFNDPNLNRVVILNLNLAHQRIVQS
jgi:hypothetical protein